MGCECAAGVSGSTGIRRGRPLSPREDTKIFSLKTVYLEFSFTWCLCRLVWHSEIGPFIWKQLWFCCGCSDFSRTEIWPILIPRRSQNFQPNNQCAPWVLSARPLSLLRLVVKLSCCLRDSDYEMWCGPGACPYLLPDPESGIHGIHTHLCLVPLVFVASVLPYLSHFAEQRVLLFGKLAKQILISASLYFPSCHLEGVPSLSLHPKLQHGCSCFLESDQTVTL